nr:MAG TPA: hypothetical protein [Caudoviricetes sp.]
MILSTWKVEIQGRYSSLYTKDPVLTLCSTFPEDPHQTQYLPYADAEPRVLELLARNKCADRVRIFGGEVRESNYEDLYEALHKIKKARPDIKIYLFFNQCVFTLDGYMRSPNTKMLYNCLSQCDTVVEDNTNVFKSRDDWEGAPVHMWIPATHRGYVMLEGGQYTPPMPPWSDSDQWVMLPTREDGKLLQDLATQTRQRIQHMQRDQFVISAAPSSVAQFMKLLRKVYNNDGYCPSIEEHSPQTKCVCEEFRNTEEGTCRCGLYKKHRRITHSEPKTPSTMAQINRVLDESKEVL